MNETQRLAEFIMRPDYEDLPQDVVEATKILMVDNITCAFHWFKNTLMSDGCRFGSGGKGFRKAKPRCSTNVFI